MNQAISVLEDMICECQEILDIWYYKVVSKHEIIARVVWLEEAKKRISSLPSDTQWIDEEDDWLLFWWWGRKWKEIPLPSLESKIDTLQRYFYEPVYDWMSKDKHGEYIRYDDLVNLFKQS